MMPTRDEIRKEITENCKMLTNILTDRFCEEIAEARRDVIVKIRKWIKKNEGKDLSRLLDDLELEDGKKTTELFAHTRDGLPPKSKLELPDELGPIYSIGKPNEYFGVLKKICWTIDQLIRHEKAKEEK